MLRLDLFQTLARVCNVLPVFLRLVCLQTLAPQLFIIRLDLAFEIARLFIDSADCADESLPCSFLQVQTSNLGGDLKTSARQLAPVTQQFLRTLASRKLQLFGEFIEFFQPSLVETLDVVKTFDRPLQILFTAILVLLGLHLVRKSHNVADVERTGSQLITNPEQLNDCNWRTCDRFFRTLLTALDAL